MGGTPSLVPKKNLLAKPSSRGTKFTKKYFGRKKRVSMLTPDPGNRNVRLVLVGLGREVDLPEGALARGRRIGHRHVPENAERRIVREAARGLGAGGFQIPGASRLADLRGRSVPGGKSFPASRVGKSRALPWGSSRS